MTKNQFIRFTELYYELTDGRPQIDCCPDIEMEISSISWSVRARIFVNGFTRGKEPDINIIIDNETSDDYIYWALDTLQKLVEIKQIYLSNPLYDKQRDKIIKSLSRKVDF